MQDTLLHEPAAGVAIDPSVWIWQPTISGMVRYARLMSAPLDVAWNGDGSRVVAAYADVRFV